MPIREVILQVLTICGYSGDKAEYVDKFERSIQIETLYNHVKTLPQDKKEKVKAILAGTKQDPGIAVEIHAHINQEAFQIEFQKVATKALLALVTPALQSITAEQTQKLEAYFRLLMTRQIVFI